MLDAILNSGTPGRVAIVLTDSALDCANENAPIDEDGATAILAAYADWAVWTGNASCDSSGDGDCSDVDLTTVGTPNAAYDPSPYRPKVTMPKHVRHLLVIHTKARRFLGWALYLSASSLNPTAVSG